MRTIIRPSEKTPMSFPPGCWYFLAAHTSKITARGKSVLNHAFGLAREQQPCVIKLHPPICQLLVSCIIAPHPSLPTAICTPAYWPDVPLHQLGCGVVHSPPSGAGSLPRLLPRFGLSLRQLVWVAVKPYLCLSCVSTLQIRSPIKQFVLLHL